jgi:hypothetical protein
LPPSVRQKCDHNIAWVKKLCSSLPQPKLFIEVGKFDIQKLIQPDIQGKGYQQGDLYGFKNAKYYVLDRDKYTCQVCRKKGKILQIHHILYRHLGGSNRVSNLLAVCTDCHTYKNHQPGGKLYQMMKENKTKSESYAGATFMNVLRQRMFAAFGSEAHYTYGYQTQVTRERLGLPKGHFNDAIAATNPEEIKEKPKEVLVIRQFRKKKRSLHEANARKGRKEPNCEQKRNEKNTKEKNGFFLMDRVKLPNGKVGYLTGFTGSSGYAVNVERKYITSPNSKGKIYKQTALSQMKCLAHRNNWCEFHLEEKSYQFK